MKNLLFIICIMLCGLSYSEPPPDPLGKQGFNISTCKENDTCCRGLFLVLNEKAEKGEIPTFQDREEARSYSPKSDQFEIYAWIHQYCYWDYGNSSTPVKICCTCPANDPDNCDCVRDGGGGT